MKKEFIFDEEFGCSFDFTKVPLDPYYTPWIDFVLQIPELVQNKSVPIETLPMMKLDKLTSEQEKIMIYSLLCYITNAYLFNNLQQIP